MKSIHLAGIPCKTEEPGGLTYTHQHKLITCSKCRNIINGVSEDVEQAKEVKNDKRRTKRESTK